MPRKPSKPKTTRRGKNEGSVYRRKDGKWVGQVTVGYHPDTGKPIRKYTYANTREEAAHWIALTLVSETSKAAPSLASELLLKDFLHRWLTTFKTYEVCSRTMELYYSCERLHIVPALGDIPVAALTASRIQTFLYYLQAEKQLSRRTTSLVRSILIQLYDYAVEMSLAPINPARSTKLPRQPQRPESEEKVIPIAQREAVLAAVQKDPIMRPIITALLFTGMRIGELLALQWKHIDFAAHTITIAQSVTRELTFDENGKTIDMTDVLGSTKTRTSHRVIQAPGVGADTAAGMDALRGDSAKRAGGADTGGLRFHQHTHHVHANIQWLPRQLSSLPGSQRLFRRGLESPSVSSYLCLYAFGAGDQPQDRPEAAGPSGRIHHAGNLYPCGAGGIRRRRRRCGYRLAAVDGRHLHAQAQRRSRQGAATADRPDVIRGHDRESQVFVRLPGHKRRTA